MMYSGLVPNRRSGAIKSHCKFVLGHFIVKTKLLTIIVAAGLAGHSAFAADVPAPVYKAPPPARAYDWSGPYVGGHLGYDWGRTRILDNVVLTEPGAPTNGAVGGLLAGYRWQSGMFVYGLEADIGAANLRGAGLPVIVAVPPNQYFVDWTSAFRGQFGFVILPNTLFFAAGGLALAGFTFQDGATGNKFGTVLPGWTIGAGIDHAFTPNFIGRIEYLYADYGNKTYEIAPGDFYNAAFKAQTLRGALIWKFGP